MRDALMVLILVFFLFGCDWFHPPFLENDMPFLPGGGADDNIWAVAMQSDGKILIGGAFTHVDGKPKSGLARLNHNGSFDVTFNPGGVGTAGGATNVVTPITVQPDGKILIAGGFYYYNGVGKDAFTRINADGSLDQSFLSGTGGNDYINAIKVDKNGKILLGGRFTAYDGTPANRIARLNSNGTIDGSFNNGGSGADGEIWCIALQNNGQILIGGSFSSYNGIAANYIARLNTDGTRDATFNFGGSDASSLVRCMAVQSDGKIIIGGSFTSYNGTPVNRVARLNHDGKLDTSFNSGGSGADNTILYVVLQEDGKILLGGTSFHYNGATYMRGIGRLQPDGSIDSSFYLGSGANGFVHGFFVQKYSGGKIFVGGSFTSFDGVAVNGIVRLHPNGKLDR